MGALGHPTNQSEISYSSALRCFFARAPYSATCSTAPRCEASVLHAFAAHFARASRHALHAFLGAFVHAFRAFARLYAEVRAYARLDRLVRPASVLKRVKARACFTRMYM